MKKQIEQERQDIERLTQQLHAKRAAVQEAESRCHHEWGKTEAAHIYHEGYTCPGDPPGTMGIDWRGPVEVPPRTEYRWKRVCKHCGKVEYTTQTNEMVVKTPKF